MDEALALLARIVNHAETTAGSQVATVPVELLNQARDLLEGFRENGTAEIQKAANRVF